MSSVYAYLFEARGLQRHIMEGGRLADMVAASNMIDDLCRGPLDAAIVHVGASARLTFSRRAGGAFYCTANSEDSSALGSLRDLWGLLVPELVPGMEFVHCIAQGKDEFEAVTNGLKLLAQQRNTPAAELPEPGPLAARAPRTGRAAVQRTPLSSGEELADRATAAKRRRSTGTTTEALGKRFLRPDKTEDLVWPRNFDPDADPKEGFPFLPGNSYLGIIHIDGNGFGMALRTVHEAVQQRRKDYVRLFRSFSELLERATQGAAQHATEAVLLPNVDADRRMPARPLVLGGDDITIIVRADLALHFAREFICEFERLSAAEMNAFKKETKISALPEGFSAGGGIVYCRASQPFQFAYRLAEGIMSAAKADAKKQSLSVPPSTLGFQRVTVSLLEKYTDYLERAQTVRGGAMQMTLGSYAVQPAKGGKLATLDAVSELASLLQAEALARGPTRRLATLLAHNANEAQKTYARWRTGMMEVEHRAELDRFDHLLGTLGVKALDQIPAVVINGASATPLGDALALASVGHRHWQTSTQSSTP